MAGWVLAVCSMVSRPCSCQTSAKSFRKPCEKCLRRTIYAVSLVFHDRHSVSNAWTRMAPSCRRNQSSRAATAVAAFPPQLTAYPKDDIRCHSAAIASMLGSPNFSLNYSDREASGRSPVPILVRFRHLHPGALQR